MSTVFLQRIKNQRGWSKTAGGSLQARREERCGLCRGELYPGDPYFELEGRVVCEDCLGRYAREYFAAQRRWVSRLKRDFDTV